MEKHRNLRKHTLSEIKQNTREAPDISMQEYEQSEDTTHFKIPQNTKGTQDISKFHKILEEHKTFLNSIKLMNTNKKIENPQNTRASAAQTTQYNGDGQDVSNSHKTPKKHESHKTRLKVQS